MTFRDFEEFFASLNARRVRYLIVGGYAVGFHARPRATKDIDVLVDTTATNARRVIAAVETFFGGKDSSLTEAKLRDPRTLIVLGSAPVRIDILTSIDGLASFAAAWKRRAGGSYGKEAVSYLSLVDLVASKRAAGRPQDLADVDVLERVARRTAARSSTAARKPRSRG